MAPAYWLPPSKSQIKSRRRQTVIPRHGNRSSGKVRKGPAPQGDWVCLLRRRTGDRAPHHQIDRPDLAAGAFFQARYPCRQPLGDALAGETDG